MPVEKKIQVKTIIIDGQMMLIYQPLDVPAIEIAQGDPRFQKIIDAAMPDLLEGRIATVDIAEGYDTTMEKFEEKTNGLVRFFRVAKDKVASFFSTKTTTTYQPASGTYGQQMGVQKVEPVVTPLGNAPINPNLLNQSSPSAEQKAREELLSKLPPEPVVPPRAVETNPAMAAPYGEKPVLKEVPKPNYALDEHGKQQRRDAVAEIIKHAKPIEEGNALDKGLDKTSTDTIIAVVEDKKTGERVVVPDAHHMKNHMAHAVKHNSPEGLVRFMKRVGSVASKRQHSVDDLMNFMKRNDMPIAADGSILAYKTLRNSPDAQKGKYVDIHSGNVFQDVGCRVFMSEKLVDPDRRNACSNGLHIARRGYVGGFRGSVCMLIRIDPEDVIAVPHEDANKMRVSGYDIVHQLSAEDYSAVCRDEPFTNNSASKQVLADLMAGKYPPITRTVEITGAYGAGLVVTDITPTTPTPYVEPVSMVPVAQESAPETNHDHATAVEFLQDTPVMNAPTVDPNAVHQAAQAAKLQGNAFTAGKLYDAVLAAQGGSAEELAAAEALLAFKKSKKKGWPALGLHSDVGDELNAIVNKDAKPE